MREGARLRLDYSAQSLWRVDRVIDGIRREKAPYAAVETALRGLGAYAGEVIVRQTGGEWWTTGGDHWVRTPDGRLWDPMDEALALLRRGRFAPSAVPGRDVGPVTFPVTLLCAPALMTLGAGSPERAQDSVRTRTVLGPARGTPPRAGVRRGTGRGRRAGPGR
ncbi:hypothetical protein SVIOM342S_07020 [Streptomyces violaceorubidus]